MFRWCCATFNIEVFSFLSESWKQRVECRTEDIHHKSSVWNEAVSSDDLQFFFFGWEREKSSQKWSWQKLMKMSCFFGTRANRSLSDVPSDWISISSSTFDGWFSASPFPPKLNFVISLFFFFNVVSVYQSLLAAHLFPSACDGGRFFSAITFMCLLTT